MSTWHERWHKQQERFRSVLHSSYVHRLLGERIFHHDIWAVDKASVAGGLTMGLFVAFTPTIPFQMLLCVAGALLLRVNLPVALAACWITNPLTALPIYIAANRCGRWMLEDSRAMEITMKMLGSEGGSRTFMEQTLYLWAGSFIFASVTAVLGNVAVRLAWRERSRFDDTRNDGKEQAPPHSTSRCEQGTASWKRRTA